MSRIGRKNVPRRNREAEQREIKKLKESIIKELETGGRWSPMLDAFVASSGTTYPREYLEDANLTRFIPDEYKFKKRKKDER